MVSLLYNAPNYPVGCNIQNRNYIYVFRNNIIHQKIFILFFPKKYFTKYNLIFFCFKGEEKYWDYPNQEILDDPNIVVVD